MTVTLTCRHWQLSDLSLWDFLWILVLHQRRPHSSLPKEKGLGWEKGPSPSPLHLLEAWRPSKQQERQTSCGREVRQERQTSCMSEGRWSRRSQAPGGAEELKGERECDSGWEVRCDDDVTVDVTLRPVSLVQIQADLGSVNIRQEIHLIPRRSLLEATILQTHH